MENQLIIGIPGSGKTRAAQSIAQAAVESGATVTVVTHRPDEWDGLHGDIRATDDTAAITSLPAHLRRNTDTSTKTTPMLLIIDQLDRAMNEDEDVADAVDVLVRQGRSSGVSVLVTAQDARRVPRQVIDNVDAITVTGYRGVIPHERQVMWLGLDPADVTAAFSNGAAVVTKHGWNGELTAA